MGGEKSRQDHLLVVLPFPETTQLSHALDKIRKKHPSLKVSFHKSAGYAASTAEIDDEFWHSVTILATFSVLPTPEQATNIKLIHFVSAGVDKFVGHPIFTDTDITLTNSSGIHGPAISEWVILQILSQAHKQKELLKRQREHSWHGSESSERNIFQSVQDAVGMRLGVLGYGSIGRQTARVCKAMGMDVLAYTASPRKTPESKKDGGYIPPGLGDPDGSIPGEWYSGLEKTSLQHFLQQDIDILLVAVPLTKDTLHFLGEEEFKILGAKRNAFVLNISRGTIIRQDALIKYCRLPPAEGGLRGAALDVTDPEPLGPDSELWDVDNIAVTPHISAVSTAYWTRSFDVLDTNITNLEAGRPPINRFDRRKGY